MNLYGEEVTEHMTLRDMEYIAAIAEDKSITRAVNQIVCCPAGSEPVCAEGGKGIRGKDFSAGK